MKTINKLFAFAVIFSAVCLLPFASLAQVDTANFEFKASGSDGKYTMLTNKGTFLGKAAGEIVTPIVITAQAIDTSKWLFVPIGSDGTYRLIENKETFYGKDSGTVRAQIMSQLESYGTATTSSGICTLNTLIGKVTTDQGAGNETTVITINNNLFTVNSVISVTAYIQDPVDDAMVFINHIDPGNHFFTVRVSRIAGGSFTAEPTIFFKIENQ